MEDDKYKELLEKIENGIRETMESEKYKAFLKVQSRFHKYSFSNAMLIFLQRPDATMVAGYEAWKKLDRHVIKGEKGIGIFAPCPYKYEKLVDRIDPRTNMPLKDPDTGQVIQEKKTIEGMTFKKVTVFDIKQTEGRELPTICDELQGNSINAGSIIKAIREISEVPVVEKDIESGAKGYYSRAENIIAVKKGMSLDQAAKTLIHEYAHSLLHSNEEGAMLDRATKEVQAESVAYIVSDHFGVDTSGYSFEYLAIWSNGRELDELKASFVLIQKTADRIIQAMGNAMSKELQIENEVKEEVDIRDKIIGEYKQEFPAIKYILGKTAQMIDNLNNEKGHVLTIKEIKQLYRDAGRQLEGSSGKGDTREFRILKEVVDGLKEARLRLKHEQAHEKTKNKRLHKQKTFEIAQ